MGSYISARKFSHLVHITRTDHPGALVAGCKLGMRVLSFRIGGTDHTRRHGEDLCKQILVAQHVPQAKRDIPQNQQMEHIVLQYIEVTSLAEQEPRFPEVAPSAKSDWRGGLNLKPTEMESKLKTVSQPAGPCDIDVDESGQQVLVANDALKEGAVAAVAPCLIYDSDAKLQAFLKSDDACKPLYGACVRVRGVEMGDTAEDPVPKTLFAVLVGREMLVRPASAKHRPNVKLVAHPACGPNDGFLKLIVATKNNSGIGRGTRLYMDFGTCYNHELVKKQVGELSKAPISTTSTVDAAGTQAGGTAGASLDHHDKSTGADTEAGKATGKRAAGGRPGESEQKKSKVDGEIEEKNKRKPDEQIDSTPKRRHIESAVTPEKEKAPEENSTTLAAHEKECRTIDNVVSIESLSEGLTKLEWVLGADSVTLYMDACEKGKRLMPKTALAYLGANQGIGWVTDGTVSYTHLTLPTKA